MSTIRAVFNGLLKLPRASTQFIRHSSFKSSEFYQDIGPIPTKYEISKDPIEWSYVQNILPRATIPEPVKKEEYPSGWKPQEENLRDRPYFVERTKNHMIPVYLVLSNHNIRRQTVIKKIQGDIWLLENELTDFLKTLTIKPIRLQVHEFAGKITINGDFVNAIKHWLTQRGY